MDRAALGSAAEDKNHQHHDEEREDHEGHEDHEDHEQYQPTPGATASAMQESSGPWECSAMHRAH